MNGASMTDLPWLPRPGDFRGSCAALRDSSEACGPHLRDIATSALTEPQLNRLASVIGTLRRRGQSFAPLTPFRLGIIGNGTLDLLVPVLTATAARHGVILDCVKAEYGQAVQSALSPDSALHLAKCDAILIAMDHRGLPLRPGIMDQAQATANVTEAIDLIGAIRRGIREHSDAICIFQTLAPAPEPLFGNFDRMMPGTAQDLSMSFNRRLVETIRGSRDVLLDVAALAQAVGLHEWHSATQWNLAKLPFASSCLPLYADHVGRILGALRGKSRRCLILDLDNTLWGGVVGDDGLEGIVLGEGNPTGEAFLSIQRMALGLRARGVLLAVSSKNDEEVARSVFRTHAEMVLRENHIAAFRSNWDDKATNIQEIARELSLGLDAMVFLDDNPAERRLVRQFLPEVAVPELPEDPALFPRVLIAAGYFEAVAFSEEDRRRAEYYQENTKRTALQKRVDSLDEYLAGLEMEVTFSPFTADGRGRIAQLIAKSNQFNLTTRRYTEPEVEAMALDRQLLTLQVRVTDIFGDNGMICVVICRPRDGATWEIDLWLMSCRVLGRKIEETVLTEILVHARERGIERLIGVHIPSARNGMVRDHYAKLGFTKLFERPDGETEWVLATRAAVIAAPIAALQGDFAPVPV